MTGKFGSRSTTAEVLSGVDLTGKRIIVTGANTGIGFETARALAGAGASVVLGCRDRQRGDDAAARISKVHPSASVENLELDLGSLASIGAFCESLSQGPIDVVICNAGIVPSRYQQTVDGIELCVGVCHFGHFALVTKLLERILESDDPRVVMVSSESHRSPKKLDFDRFPLTESSFSTLTAYGQAKLANVLFANELQRRYGPQGLSACSLHPGALITTEIGRYAGFLGLLIKLLSPFTKNPDQGASTTVYCAARAKADEIRGNYFSHCQRVAASEEARDPEVANRLWALSEAFFDRRGS
ncbi:MAG: SDR family oxidoreductase [Pseudomonadales bacterium]|nr:SDR family oxidoreductase [Pseudomonadales bacterium]